MCFLEISQKYTIMNIQQYIRNVSSLFYSGNCSEHSYRGDLQQLLSKAPN